MSESIPSPNPAKVIKGAFAALDIVTNHSAKAESEAQYWQNNPGHQDPALEDLSDLAFITMDNPDSRDLDQALHIDQTAVDDKKTGGYRIRYALADAAYYVQPGSALFKEALQRGATYYSPLMAAPMLPNSLSEGLISLNPNVPRRALVFDIHLSEDARVQQTRVVRALIRSRAKLSYAGVQVWLDNHCSLAADQSDRAVMNCGSSDDYTTDNENLGILTNEIPDHASYQSTLLLLQTVGEKLISLSAERGVVPFDRSETAIRIDSASNSFKADRRHRYMTEQYNEQISLLCNMQGAELLMALHGHSNALQAVYRVHEAPLSKNTNSLRKTLSELAETQNLDQRWQWKENTTLAQFVQGLPSDKSSKRMKAAIQRQIMQAQRASVFQPEPDIHHALKASAYARFSSPMREVVGIFTHKELLEALKMNQASSTPDDHALRELVIKAANQARQTQRKLDKHIEFAVINSVLGADLAMSERNSYSATIIGLRRDRLYAAIDGLALDFKVYRDDLEEQFNTQYEIRRTKAVPSDSSQPLWLLGQGINLTARHYDKERKRFLFEIKPES